MPVIEELPDDDEVAKPESPAEDANNAVKKGFLNSRKPAGGSKKPERAAAARAEASNRPPVRVADILAAGQASSCSGGGGGGGATPPVEEEEEVAATGTTAPAAAASSEAAPPEAGQGSAAAPLPNGAAAGSKDSPDSCMVEGLRRRLQAGLDRVAAARGRGGEAEAASGSPAAGQEGGEEDSIEGLEAMLAPLREKWPTQQFKASRDKATQEIESALAEMRTASNDARRLRSGEERLAVADLRRATEDAIGRVRKVAEAAATRELSREARVRAATQAFHALPLAAKLRALVSERAAYLVLGGSFLAGALLMLAALAEVSSAWRCGLQCGGER